MVTYQERKENTKVYVLLRAGDVIGCFGNLKKLCDSVNDPKFLSYHTLIRKKKDRIDFAGYSIQRVRLY